MRHTDDIDDPTWHDLFDRDDRIKHLEGVVSLLSGGIHSARGSMEPLTDEIVDSLDSGIRDLVVALRKAGFNTTDSGDGESKPPRQRDLNYPHVFMVVPPMNLIDESRRLQDWVSGDYKLLRWTVEASYSPKDDVALLSLYLFSPSVNEDVFEEDYDEDELGGSSIYKLCPSCQLSVKPEDIEDGRCPGCP